MDGTDGNVPSAVQPPTEEISTLEQRIRRSLGIGYRFALSVFLSYQLYDLIFSPIWLHGYLWCLNQPLDVDFSDKAAGFILDRQLGVVGFGERVVNAILQVLAVTIVLWYCGYSRSNRTVWHLLQLSIAFGALSGLTRCVQVRHRLYSAFHESFYAYFHFFMVGIVMTWRVTERFPCEQKTSVVDEKKSQ